jgi:hypothetical protein
MESPQVTNVAINFYVKIGFFYNDTFQEVERLCSHCGPAMQDDEGFFYFIVVFTTEDDKPLANEVFTKVCYIQQIFLKNEQVNQTAH